MPIFGFPTPTLLGAGVMLLVLLIIVFEAWTVARIQRMK